MAINDDMEAQGAVMRARDMRKGANLMSSLMTAVLREAMLNEAARLTEEVAEWCERQENPREAMAMAYRRFWELDTLGKLLPGKGTPEHARA